MREKVAEASGLAPRPRRIERWQVNGSRETLDRLANRDEVPLDGRLTLFVRQVRCFGIGLRPIADQRDAPAGVMNHLCRRRLATLRRHRRG